MKLEYSSYLSISDKKDDSKVFNLDQTKIDSLDKYSLITHAHSDHVANTPQTTLASSQTISLIHNLLPTNKFDFNEINQNKEITLTDNIKFKALNAGHVLGSNMFYFETKNTSLLYTGDFNTKDSLLLKGAKPIHCDTLVIESTFGKPDFSFPDKEVIYQQLAEDISKDILKNRLIILGGYALGKSQELIKFVNKYLGEIPLVTKNIFDYSNIYKKYNVNLGNYKLLDHNINNHNIIILPVSLINRHIKHTLSHQSNREVATYIATGWNFYRGSKCVPISDHCDFNDLLEFVNQVKPRKVYTMHGFSKELAKHIHNKFKISVKPIENMHKNDIFDFI